MAENYFPSSVGIGQGGAQVLQGRTPQLSASGIVRGIEQVGKDIREEQAYQREIEALKQKERNKKIDALDESVTSIQIPKFQYAGERAVQDFWAGINEGKDYESSYNDLKGKLNFLTNLSNDYVKEKPKILEGQFRYEDGTVLGGREVYSNLMVKGFNEKEEELYKEGIEALGGHFMNTSSNMSNDFYEPSKFNFTKNFNDYVIAKFKNYAEEVASTYPLDDKTGVQTTRRFKNPKEFRKELKSNPELFELYKRSRIDAYNAPSKQEEIRSDFEAFIDNYDYPEEVKLGFFTSPKEGKGKGLKEGEDFIYTSKTKKGEYINPLTGEKSPLQNPTGIIADIDVGMVYMRKPLRIRQNIDGQITEVDLVGVYLDDGKYKGIVQIENPNYMNGADTFEEVEVDLSDDNVSILKNQGVNLENINNTKSPQGNNQNEALPTGAVETTEEDFFGE